MNPQAVPTDAPTTTTLTGRGAFERLLRPTTPLAPSTAPSNVPVTVSTKPKNGPSENRPEPIDRFTGDYAFLSNFAYSPIKINGQVWPTVEHAYQAAKTKNPQERDLIRAATSPAKAKTFGKTVTLRADWEQIKIEVMYLLLKGKFKPDSPLASQLIATGDRPLIEGNWWNDQFWGVCEGKGSNHLGKLLMRVRKELTLGPDSDTILV